MQFCDIAYLNCLTCIHYVQWMAVPYSVQAAGYVCFGPTTKIKLSGRLFLSESVQPPDICGLSYKIGIIFTC